jgi:hypothetical protein
MSIFTWETASIGSTKLDYGVVDPKGYIHE